MFKGETLRIAPVTVKSFRSSAWLSVVIVQMNGGPCIVNVTDELPARAKQRSKRGHQNSNAMITRITLDPWEY